MRERDHDNLEYEGGPEEKAKITVTAQGTTHLVEYTLNGVTKKLKKGDPIEFDLKSAVGQQTDLQIVLDFNAQGTYDVDVENIPNCSEDDQHLGKCVNTVAGPPKEFLTFVFFVT